MRYSSCVTSTPLNLLVTALDGRCDAVVRCIVLPFDRVVLRSNSVQPLLSFQCLPSCALSGFTVGDDASVRSTSPSAPIFLSGKGGIYHAYNFKLIVPSSRIERLLDPTTYIYASHMKTPNNHVPPHPSKQCIAMLLCSLLSHCLVCMLGCYISIILFTPWIGLSPSYYYCCG